MGQDENIGSFAFTSMGGGSINLKAHIIKISKDYLKNSNKVAEYD